MPAIDQQGVLLPQAPQVPLLVHFDEQYVWSFTPGRDGAFGADGFRIDWPAALRPFLIGTTRLRIATYDGDVVLLDQEVRFGEGEAAQARVAFVDEDGAPYSIDKVGHLTRSFEETPEGLKSELLDATETVLRELRERCGVDAYLCYGALLGAVRQGTMLGHDSDVDLCYYSHHTTPVDIIRESYRIYRELSALGWQMLRMSAGDMKVIWPLSDGRSAHIDIFSAFTINGTFYQFGNRNGSFDAAAHLVPLGSVTLEGRSFPAPRHPEEMLAFIYGPGWRVPDPGFRYRDNPVGTRRLDGWYRGFRTEVPLWAGVYQGAPVERVPTGPSPFARWVEPQLGAGAKVADLGAGTGRDVFWLRSQGHPALAVDYSLPALTHMHRVRDALGFADVPLEVVSLNETRHVSWLLGTLGRDPHHLYARGLVGSLDEDARHNLFRLAAAALRRGGKLFLEFSAPSPAPLPEPSGLTRRFDPVWLQGEIESHGGIVEHLEVGPGEDMYGEPDPAVARMRVGWAHP